MAVSLTSPRSWSQWIDLRYDLPYLMCASLPTMSLCAEKEQLDEYRGVNRERERERWRKAADTDIATDTDEL